MDYVSSQSWGMPGVGVGLQPGVSTATSSETTLVSWALDVVITLVGIAVLLWFFAGQFQRTLAQSRTYATELEAVKESLEEQVSARTTELQESYEESQYLHQQILESQQQMIQELSTPVIPVMDAPDGAGGIIVMPLVGSIDSMRAQDITRSLLAGISQHQARIVIVDVTSVSIMDTGIVNRLNSLPYTFNVKI